MDISTFTYGNWCGNSEAVRIASGNQSVGIVSGRNTDITAAQSVTVAASNSVSLFAQSAGMQLLQGRAKWMCRLREMR